jgi:predicted Zn-dependent protease
VLRNFEASAAAGEDPNKIEFSAVVDQQGQRTYRYMKAIPTAEKPCLACHGKTLAPQVAARLKELYPDDRATGYAAGEIRGAFTLSRPLQ